MFDHLTNICDARLIGDGRNTLLGDQDSVIFAKQLVGGKWGWLGLGYRYRRAIVVVAFPLCRKCATPSTSKAVTTAAVIAPFPLRSTVTEATKGAINLGPDLESRQYMQKGEQLKDPRLFAEAQI